MSQIELIMSAALGFAAAALIALLVGRLVWSYAVRLGRRRIERSGPVAMVEMQADRDRLKAEYAMLSRRFDMRIGDLKTRLAEQMADVSRLRNRIDGLAATLETREQALTQREAEIAQLKEQLSPLENELAARTQALQQLKEQLRDRDALEAELERELALARSTRGREEIPPVARISKGVETRTGPPVSEPSGEEGVGSRIDQLSALARQIETQRLEIEREHAELKALKEEFVKSQKRRRRKPRENAPPPVPVVATDAAPAAHSERIESLDQESQRLAETIEAAEKEAAALQSELRSLDETWVRDPAKGDEEATTGAMVGSEVVQEPDAGSSDQSATLVSPDVSGATHATAREDASATVITLASRIRALQRGAPG